MQLANEGCCGALLVNGVVLFQLFFFLKLKEPQAGSESAIFPPSKIGV